MSSHSMQQPSGYGENYVDYAAGYLRKCGCPNVGGFTLWNIRGIIPPDLKSLSMEVGENGL